MHDLAVTGPARSARLTRAPEPGSVISDHHTILDGIGAVIFDFDGTLADTTPLHEQALREALQPYELRLDHDWYLQHAGLSIRDLLAQLAGARQLDHDEIIRRSRASLLATIDLTSAIGCVVALLRTARRAGLPCAIASGATRLLVLPGLKALGLTDEFAVVITREDVPLGKPDPGLYLEASRRLQVARGRCLAVDDAPDGVTAARAAGMRVITLRGGHLVSAEGRCDATGRDTTRPAADGTAPPSTTGA